MQSSDQPRKHGTSKVLDKSKVGALACLKGCNADLGLTTWKLTIRDCSTDNEHVAVGQSDECWVPAATAVRLNLGGEIGLHHVSDVVVRPISGHKSADVGASIIDARPACLISSNDEDSLIKESDVARAEGVV